MNRPATPLDRARAKVELGKLEAQLLNSALDPMELQHLQPLRDEIAQRLRGGPRVGEAPQTALRLER